MRVLYIALFNEATFNLIDASGHWDGIKYLNNKINYLFIL